MCFLCIFKNHPNWMWCFRGTVRMQLNFTVTETSPVLGGDPSSKSCRLSCKGERLSFLHKRKPFMFHIFNNLQEVLLYFLKHGADTRQIRSSFSFSKGPVHNFSSLSYNNSQVPKWTWIGVSCGNYSSCLYLQLEDYSPPYVSHSVFKSVSEAIIKLQPSIWVKSSRYPSTIQSF